MREPTGPCLADRAVEVTPVGKEVTCVPDCLYVEETRVRRYPVSEIEHHFRNHAGRNRTIAFVTNAGLGVRQGLVTALFGSKGDIVMMGRALKEVALRAAGEFIRLLPPDDWLAYAPTDLVVYWDDAEPTVEESRPTAAVDVVALILPGQLTTADPPLPGIFAARRHCLARLEEETFRCLRHCGVGSEAFDPIAKSVWWGFLIRPALLTREQWRAASGHVDFDREVWERIWRYAQRFKHRLRIGSLVVRAVSTNMNSNRELHALYQRAAGCVRELGAFDASRVRELFGLGSGRAAGAQLRGDVLLDPKCLVHRSIITVSPGLRLRLAAGVVIDDSEVHVRGQPGQQVSIPEGTVVAHSRISGELLGNGRGGALVGVDSTAGVRFLSRAIQTTVLLADGERRTLKMPLQQLPSFDAPIPGLGDLSLRRALSLARPRGGPGAVRLGPSCSHLPARAKAEGPAIPRGEVMNAEPLVRERMQEIFYSEKILWHSDRLDSYGEEFKSLRGKTRLADLSGVVPVTMEIDLSNLCSHRCPSCAGRRLPESENEQLFPAAGDGESIPTARAADYIAQLAAAGVRGLIFTGGGEPTAHSGLVDLVELAVAVGMRVGLITHGGLLHKHDLGPLLRACTWIRFSIDAGDASDFESVHGRGRTEWRRVWRNLSKVVDEKRRLFASGRRAPTVGVAFLAGPQNIERLVALAELSRAHGADYLQVRPFHGCLDFDVTRHLSDARRCFDSQDFKVVASLQKYRRVHGGEIEPRDYSYCHMSQFASVICANEKMYVCCHLRNVDRFCIGDLRTESFVDILQGRRRAAVSASVRVRECQRLCRGDHVNRQIQGLTEIERAPGHQGPPPPHVDFL